MASLSWWTWIWVNSGWWTGRPGVLWFMGSRRVGHDWATELNWRIIFTDILFSSVAQSCPTPCSPWTAAHQDSLFITNSLSLLKFMSIESVMPSNHLILCCTLLFLPSIFPSIRVFSNESTLHMRWPKHWSFSFSISPSNKYSRLIFFMMDWLDLLKAQGTFKSLLRSSKHQFFSTQLSLSPALTSIHYYWKNHSFN